MGAILDASREEARKSKMFATIKTKARTAVRRG